MIWKVAESDPPCIVIADESPRSGEENMELDRRALELVCKTSSETELPQTLCRIYRWDEPTVTLGYFQDPDVPVPNEISKCPRVKRLTGGGAILHDLELTYSIAVPAQHSIRKDPLKLYEIIHAAIVETLSRQDIVSCMRQDSKRFRADYTGTSLKGSKEPFLCFLRQDDRDIVLGKHKIVGSAQRRRKGSILQHGSILLKASRLIPEVLGLQDLAPQLDSQQLSDQLATAIGQSIAPEVEILGSKSGDQKLKQLLGGE